MAKAAQRPFDIGATATRPATIGDADAVPGARYRRSGAIRTEGGRHLRGACPGIAFSSQLYAAKPDFRLAGVLHEERMNVVSQRHHDELFVYPF